MSTTPVSPKAKATVAGGSSAGALAIILVWIATENGVQVPAEVATSLGVLIATGAAAVAAWVKRDPRRDR